jgi:uncharacterized protein (UPF0548 family)
MLLLREPTDDEVREFLAGQAGRDFSYPEVGRSRGLAGPRPTVPPGYWFDRRRTRLGRGAVVFAAACDALRRWAMFDIGWVAIRPAAPAGESWRPWSVVSPVVRLGPVRWANACRVVYAEESADHGGRTFAMAYGTLPAHAEIGEERFAVEWRFRDDAVSYEVSAFSRPGHPLARLGLPVVRLMQKRFGAGSCAAMRRAVAAASPTCGGR